MNKQKVTLAVLAILISIKFILLPWNEWVIESQEATARLSNFEKKQQQVIENEALIHDKLSIHKQSFEGFVDNLPTIKSGDKANTLWFSLVDTIKTEDIKVYNQRVEFEQFITDNVGYVTGTLFIKGNASDVMQAVLKLEAKAPYIFLEQVKLIRSPGKKVESLVTQLYLRYWFSQVNKIESE
jgi:hypothetical protein